MPTEFPKPEYPKILTRKDWDKNKGVFAKMHGKTGMGEKMDEVQKLFDAVDWEKINLTKRREGWKWGGEGVTISKPSWDKIMNEAKSEVTGNLAKLSKELYELRDLAKDVQAQFKKSKTIPSSSTKHVGEIATTADQLGVKLNKNSMSPILVKMEEEFVDFVQKTYADSFVKALKVVVAKHPKTLEGVRADPTLANFTENACRKMARDYTTPLGNIAKVHDKGFKIKNGPAAQKLFDVLTPYANLQVKPNDDAEDVKKHLVILEKMLNAANSFASSV
jgi:hypothetical protein